MTTKEWLQIEPTIEEIKHNNDKKKSAFIPIRVIKGATKLGNKEHIKDWELIDYRSYAFGSQKLFFFSAFGSLKVTFTDGTVSIKPGGTTFPVTGKGNTFYESTAQSEVIKNAAKNLGPQFGSTLNQDLLDDDLDISDMPPDSDGYEDINTQIKNQTNAVKK